MPERVIASTPLPRNPELTGLNMIEGVFQYKDRGITISFSSRGIVVQNSTIPEERRLSCRSLSRVIC